MGGTRIGVSVTDSVVDKNLKVHGIENLYITGSSVFRTSGHCHPTYTIVQLSLRLAEHIISIKKLNSIMISKQEIKFLEKLIKKFDSNKKK